jgi:hypothetical protein
VAQAHKKQTLSDTRSEAVTREYISSPVAAYIAALFPIPFLTILVYLVWKAVTGGVSTVVRDLPPASPDWGRWLFLIVMAVITIYSCRRIMVLKRVTLVDDRLSIENLTTRIEIPLGQVLSLEWTQTAADFNTPEAALVLRNPTPFGTYILFTPRSEDAFERLSARIEAAGTTSPLKS